MNNSSSSLTSRIRALNRGRRIVPVKIHPRLRALPGIRAVLFDVYGTLVDSGKDLLWSQPERIVLSRMHNVLRRCGFIPACPRAGIFILDAWQEQIARAHRLARARGMDYPEVDVRDIWSRVLGRGLKQGWIVGRPDDRKIARIAIEFEGVQNPVALMPGVKKALARLRQGGIKMGIVSNAQFYTPLVLQVLLGKSLAEIGFDRALCAWSYRLGRAKPSPVLLGLALKRAATKHGLEPREVLVIGNDWNCDVIPARRAGCRAALLAGSRRSFPHPAGAFRRRRPDLLLTHWAQLENIGPPARGRK